MLSTAAAQTGGSIFHSGGHGWDLPRHGHSLRLGPHCPLGMDSSEPTLATDLRYHTLDTGAETEARYVRNLIIQIYYHQEVCNDAVVFLNK